MTATTLSTLSLPRRMDRGAGFLRQCSIVSAGSSRMRVPQYVSGNFTSWRWLLLAGCLAPAYWAGEGLARALEAAIEWKYFENRQVLYYLIGTTVRGALPCQGSCRTSIVGTKEPYILAAPRLQHI